MLLVSTQGIIEAGNQAFASQFQTALETLPGRRLDAVTVDSPETVDTYLRACAQSQQVISGSLSVRNGEHTTPCRTYGLYVPNSAVRSARVLLRFHAGVESNGDSLVLTHALDKLNAEIAQRQQTEDALRRQRETLQVTLSSIGDAVIVTDAQGRVTFLNGVAETLTGWSSPDATQEPCKMSLELSMSTPVNRSRIR